MEKKLILVIDDEKLIVKSTCMALELYDYRTLGALNGAEGLRLAREGRPDLVLLDVMMPELDGWQVLQQLKNDTATLAIPVIIFTAKEYSNGREMAQSRGACDYVAKPFDPEELAALIGEHLGKGA